MDMIGYLTILRRRWMLLAVCTALTLGVVWLTLPKPGEAVATPQTYQATATLIASPTTEVPINLPLAALFTTVGDVPERAARRLDHEGNAQVLAASVTAAASSETGTLTIGTTGSSAEDTARTANVFAEELIAHFARSSREQAENQLRLVNRSIEEYARRVSNLDRRIAVNPGSTALIAEREGVQSHYQTLVATAAALENDFSFSPPLEFLQRAVGVRTSTGPTFTPPTDARNRLLIGALLGLAFGGALALVVERVDSRVRSREQAERALHLPVLAEIPNLPWAARGRPTVLSATSPGSATAEAYRTLRSAVLLLRPGETDPRRRLESAPPAVILVTSPRAGDGKTSTVANLAAVMAESGRTVLVLSLDFRNPRIHDFFDAPNGTGVSDLLSANRADELEHVVRDTPFAGVRIATSGQETSHPGALLAGAGPLFAEARKLADIVLVDTAPLLAVSDAIDLSAHVDAVLVVSRANRTTTAHAHSTHRLLSRLGVPALGAVLVGTARTGTYMVDLASRPASPPVQDDSFVSASVTGAGHVPPDRTPPVSKRPDGDTQ